MARKYFHINFNRVSDNLDAMNDNRPGDIKPPLRVAVEGAAPGVNRFFNRVEILGQDGKVACTFSFEENNFSPGNADGVLLPRLGLSTLNAIIVDGVRIE